MVRGPETTERAPTLLNASAQQDFVGRTASLSDGTAIGNRHGGPPVTERRIPTVLLLDGGADMPIIREPPTETRSRLARDERRTTTVITWNVEDGTRSDLDAFLRGCRRHGWQIQECVPRLLDGPRFGALVVMRRPTTPQPRTPRGAGRPVAAREQAAEKQTKRRAPVSVG